MSPSRVAIGVREHEFSDKLADLRSLVYMRKPYLPYAVIRSSVMAFILVMSRSIMRLPYAARSGPGTERAGLRPVLQLKSAQRLP